MQYFILAGLSAEIFETIKKTIERETQSKSIFGKAIKVKQSYEYSQKEISDLAASVRGGLSDYIASGNTCHLSLIYVPHEKSDTLLKSFIPATLNFKLPQQINTLPKASAVSTVMRVMRCAQGLSGRLNTIFESNIRRSAIPLPYRNYQVNNYPEKIAEVCSFDYDSNPNDIREIFGLPTATTTSPKITVFSDHRDLLFIPAKRREFHGHEVSSELPLAWLKGAFRIGRSIPVGFHYDVKPERPPLNRFKFEDCETGEVCPKGEHTYINITPNDRTRLGKGS